ncbi:SE1832 family protein [Metabacillus sediminilitoris]|uniref:SE1832 family protein n=1 Tax=Metabacillus sediminilitoris TaxID=2567941 RepID=UPI001454DFF0|nr:SE1832 family protein [Metabacillus sediminilitoris]
MDAREIHVKIDDLKMEYIKVQGDIEKLESTGHSIEKLDAKLAEIENELMRYRAML